MSLATLIRNATLGFAFILGCGPSGNKFDRAFETAQEQLQRQGIEVRGGLWNKEDQYTQLFREMRYNLGDVQSALSRRYGADSCDEVGLSSYNSSTYYCGPGAVQGNCDRIAPGDCQNEVCLEHDLCVEEVLQESQDGELCLWSRQTQRCDEQFFQGYGRCNENDDCGFYCHMIGAIALNLSAIENTYAAVGPGCLWNGNYGQPQEKKPKYKDPNDTKDLPEKKPVDESLRELCVDYYEMGLRDCVNDPASPQELEEIVQGICYQPNLASLEANRARFECAYNMSCNDFLDCTGR